MYTAKCGCLVTLSFSSQLPGYRPALRLPKSARVVVWVIVNVEEWDIHGPMPRTMLPPPGGTQVIPDIPNFRLV